MTRILYIHSCTQDYLADSLLHGLRSLLGVDCVDVPCVEYMYDTLSCDQLYKLRGHGMSLYGMLPDLPELSERRNDWHQRIDEYDFIVVSNIWRLSIEQTRVIKKHIKKCILIDGEDQAAHFPFSGHVARSFHNHMLSRYRNPYYKRELYSSAHHYGQLKKMIPGLVIRRLVPKTNIRPIAFSIPSVKISWGGYTSKIKDFPRHMVDSEVSQLIDGSVYSPIMAEKYAFVTEIDYYSDLRLSRYGITTKRAGWDCMRHYEIAANGSLLCFRNLYQKPPLCAPHGLNDGNCIVYSSAKELLERIQAISENEYIDRMAATYSWIIENTTMARAKAFLNSLN